MRKLLAALACATALVHAQSPLTTTFAGGETTTNIYFELTCHEPAGVVVDAFDLQFTDPAGTNGSFKLFVKCNGMGPVDSFNWISRDVSQFVCAGPGNLTTCNLAWGVDISENQTLGICLAFTVTENVVTPATPFLPLTYSTNELTLTAGLTSSTPLEEPSLADRIPNMNVHYTSGGYGFPNPCALTYGQSCGEIELQPSTMPIIGTPPFLFRVRADWTYPPPPGSFEWFITLAGFGPANDSLAFYGLPNCISYTTCDVIGLFPLSPLSGSASWNPFGLGAGIPPDPLLAGVSFYVQCAILDASQNGFAGARVSNGLELTLGYYQ